MDTVRDILRARGYGQCIEDADADVSADARQVLRAVGESGVCIVVAGLHDRVGVRVVRALAERAEAFGVSLALLLTKGSLTHVAEAEMAATTVPTQAFTAGQLAFNVTQNVLVPKHSAVGDDEWRTLVAATPGLEKKMLPHISAADPVVRFHGWPCGTVVRIDRRIGEQQTFPFYRCVTACA